MAKHYNFRCQFCDSGFVYEDRFIKHRCNQMRRDEEVRTPIGMAALDQYRTWMTVKKRTCPNAEQFLNSKMYTMFIKFAKFASKTGIPNIEQYIKFMVRKDIHPMIWVSDEIYGEYLRYMDKGSDPFQQANDTVSYIMDVADAIGCEMEDIFDHLAPNDVIVMLQQRKLSPWILLSSKKFVKFTENAPKEQQIQIMSIIKPATWKQRSQDNPAIVNKMKEIVHELKL